MQIGKIEEIVETELKKTQIVFSRIYSDENILEKTKNYLRKVEDSLKNKEKIFKFKGIKNEAYKIAYFLFAYKFVKFLLNLIYTKGDLPLETALEDLKNKLGTLLISSYNINPDKTLNIEKDFYEKFGIRDNIATIEDKIMSGKINYKIAEAIAEKEPSEEEYEIEIQIEEDSEDVKKAREFLIDLRQNLIFSVKDDDETLEVIPADRIIGKSNFKEIVYEYINHLYKNSDYYRELIVTDNGKPKVKETLINVLSKINPNIYEEKEEYEFFKKIIKSL